MQHPVCDKPGMANTQLLYPRRIISGQKVTAGRSQGESDKRSYQSRRRQSKYNYGGRELID